MQSKRGVAREALPFHQVYTEFSFLTMNTEGQVAPSPQHTQKEVKIVQWITEPAQRPMVKNAIGKNPPSFKNLTSQHKSPHSPFEDHSKVAYQNGRSLFLIRYRS